MFCVVVRVQVKPEFAVPFRQEILSNAAASLDREPGCRTFDVCEAPATSEFLLYELYDTEQAFQEHLETLHFKHFDAKTAGWIASKQISWYFCVST